MLERLLQRQDSKTLCRVLATYVNAEVLQRSKAARLLRTRPATHKKAIPEIEDGSLYVLVEPHGPIVISAIFSQKQTCDRYVAGTYGKAPVGIYRAALRKLQGRPIAEVIDKSIDDVVGILDGVFKDMLRESVYNYVDNVNYNSFGDTTRRGGSKQKFCGPIFYPTAQVKTRVRTFARLTTGTGRINMRFRECCAILRMDDQVSWHLSTPRHTG